MRRLRLKADGRIVELQDGHEAPLVPELPPGADLSAPVLDVRADRHPVLSLGMPRDPVPHLPGQIEAVECRIPPLQFGDHTQRLNVVIEAAELGETGVLRLLPDMAERGMTKIMRERQCFGEVFV